MPWKIPLSDLSYDSSETRAVLDVLDSRWLTMGSVTQEFETAFAEFLGAKHGVAVSNATVALHLACLALGIGPGDEVIVPSLSFVATANAVLYTGADVRFAEVIGPDDLTLSPADIQRRITPRTKAIIVMHYAGYPCRMPEIMDLAHSRNLALIEDAAHAPGASLDGRALGTWSDVGCFSFFSNKNLSTGEGGMLVTNRDDLAEKFRLLRSHGMTSLTWDRHQGHAYTYDVTDLGYNYRIDEIRSALGLAQLAKLPGDNARRRHLTQRYWDLFAQIDLPGLELPFKSAHSRPTQGDSAATGSAHIFPILLPPGADRQSFMEGMKAAGVQTSIHYPPIHTFTYYRHRYPAVTLPETESIASRQVTLPLYPALTDEDIAYVVSSAQSALIEGKSFTLSQENIQTF
jgi:dTDP-4-amino-4,6-dideoxygalactose transaminase